MKKYFDVSVEDYVPDKNFHVVRPASLMKPKDNAVMFIMQEYFEYVSALYEVKECLIFWPEEEDVPEEIANRNAVKKCERPHFEYCKFFRDNNITYLPRKVEGEYVDGSFIAKGAVIGSNACIMPGAYIGEDVCIGENVYIGAGAKLVGNITIGNNVVIRENAVLGADGLSTDRDEEGKAATMPQFGEIILEDDVQIGANTVIARGAIDETIIKRGSKIDNSCFISHNVHIGEDSFVVGETIMFGSSKLGDKAFISGNATVRNGKTIGDGATVGMGAVVVNNVEEGAVVKGNPAR